MELIHSTNGDIIIHYGVKGMKWGVRHDRQYTGSPRKKGFFSRFKKKPKVRAPSFETYDNYKRTLASSDRVKKVYSDLSKDRETYKHAYDIARKFNNDTDLVVKWQKIAAKKVIKEFGYTGKDADNIMDAFLYGDLDQGYDNSFGLYLKSKGIKSEDYEGKVMRAQETYENKISESVRKAFPDIADKGVINDHGYKVTMADVIYDTIRDQTDEELGKKGYYLWM